MSTHTGIDLSTPTAESGGELGALAFRGSDAARFLQGQLSADTEELAVGSSTLAGFHNPQGRTIALLALLRRTPEEFLAVLPRELASVVVQRLRKFVFRAKVAIEDLSGTHRVFGAAARTALPEAFGAIQWGARQMLLVPGEREAGPADAAARTSWETADIVEGLPQVYAATSETFVAQMLNLDLLGAIAFDKGCYTGQEVIARAHYRGRVKRRLQRWRTLTVHLPLQVPGAVVHSEDGRKLTVIRASHAESGLQELLAVGAFGTLPDTEESIAAGDGIVVAGPLPMPYALPE